MTEGGFPSKIYKGSAYSASVHLCMRVYVLHRHVDTSFGPLQSWRDKIREERWRAAPWLLAGSTTSRRRFFSDAATCIAIINSGTTPISSPWIQSGSVASNVHRKVKRYECLLRVKASAYVPSRGYSLIFANLVLSFILAHSLLEHPSTLMLVRKYTKQARLRELYLIIRKEEFTFSL